MKELIKEAIKEELDGSSSSDKEKIIREKVREALREELSPGTRSACLEQAKEEIEETLNRTLIEHGVHKQGLADQQCAKFYRELSDVIEDTLDMFRTTRRPNNIDGVENYEEFMDIIEDND